MCGIAGIIDFSAEGIQQSDLLKLGSVIKHRGADDEGEYICNNVGLIHKRLSIVDLSENGHQPMKNDDEQFAIVFNGEIYNHLSIRKDLENRGYLFKSTSDTETLLYAYIEFGPSVLNKLNGIFSFAVYDKFKNELFLARDHFGVKPLYISVFGSKFVFSSELKSFIDLAGFCKEINYEAVFSYINLLWCPGTQTPFKTVNKIQPGHYLKIDTKGPGFRTVEEVNNQTIRYYDIPLSGHYSPNNVSDLEFFLDYKLNNAVGRQLMSDVPVGFFLSGGLDSSLIATIAQKLLGGTSVNVFTIDSGDGLRKEGFSSDLNYARQLSRQQNFNLNVVPANIDILQDFDKMIWHLDEPQADPAPLNVLQISAEAKRQGIKVLLGGVAGDDLFSGYRRHQALFYNTLLNRVPTSLVKVAKDISRKVGERSPFARRLQKFLKEHGKSEIDQMTGYFLWMNLSTSRTLLSNDISQSLSDYDPVDFLKDQLKNIPLENSKLNKLLYLEMKSFLPDHNLNYTDKLSMAVGVEARVPYLDVDLVNFAAAIPPKLKMKGATTKYLLRKVAENYLPKEIVYRKKAGFGAPLRKWILNDMHPMIQERLSVQKINQRGLFNADAVHKLIQGNRQGQFDASYIIWSLLAIESWMEQFVDGKNLAYP